MDGVGSSFTRKGKQNDMILSNDLKSISNETGKDHELRGKFKSNFQPVCCCHDIL